MSRKNLQHITLNTTEKSTKTHKSEIDHSPEDISLYTSNNLENVHHLDFVAGLPPYLRGISSTMFVRSPWKMCQSYTPTSIEDYNTFFKTQFKAGQREFLLDFNSNISVETLTDLKSIFKDIPLNEICIRLKNDNHSLVLLAFYATIAETEGLKPVILNGTFLIDVAHYFSNSETSHVHNLMYSNSYLPQFNRIEISEDGLKSITTNPETELALMLICGQIHLQKGLEAGLQIDEIASRLSFNFSIGLHHFSEIAKLRAARLLWAKIVKSYHPKNDKSLALHIHSHTYTNQSSDHDISHSVTKSTIAAASAIFGGSQSLDTYSNKNSTPELKQLNNQTQWYLKEETQITKTIDPWGGSFYVEKRTHDIAQQAWSIYKDYKTSGKLPDLFVTELSQYKLDRSKTETSIQNLNVCITNRDETAVKDILLKLIDARQSVNENVLTLAIKAFKSQATYSEIYKAIN